MYVERLAVLRTVAAPADLPRRGGRQRARNATSRANAMRAAPSGEGRARPVMRAISGTAEVHVIGSAVGCAPIRDTNAVPNAPMRPCPTPACAALTHGGPCPKCARARERFRGTAHARGYNRAWIAFRRRFFAALVQAGIVPVCGAALPTGPQIRDSQCQDAGLLTFASVDGSSLHLDHEPPLENWERHDVRVVCDVNRIRLLCAACHSARTSRQ